MPYNIYLAKIFFILSVLSCLFSVVFLIKTSIAIWTQSSWMFPVFLFGSLSLPYVGYSLRAYVEVIWRGYVLHLFKSNKLDLMKEHYYSSVVLPSDCDVFNHMNNARYPREVDFARTRWYCDTGLIHFFQRTRKYIIMTGTTIRYRRSLEVFQSFTITTKIIYWDERNIYLQHKFMTGENFVNAIILSRMRVLSHKNADELFKEFLGNSSPPEKPRLSGELEHYLKYLETCSNNLRPASSFVVPK